MTNKNKRNSILCCILAIILCTSIAINLSRLENFEHSGTITMKWNIPKLVVIRYYFEIDNETKLSIDSYDYHKYNIGDIYTWESLINNESGE